MACEHALILICDEITVVGLLEAARAHWHESVATDSLAVDPTGVLHLMLIVITFNMFPYCPAPAPYPMLIPCKPCEATLFFELPKKLPNSPNRKKGLW